jgi:hypothetical protein
MAKYLQRFSMEPPFRLLARSLVRKFSKHVATRAQWGVDRYPAYQFGMLEAARMAQRDGLRRITAIEFGVASGEGLLAMQTYAGLIESFTGVAIDAVGFDSGAGLPSFIGDHRDHPDQWQPGDYPLHHTTLTGRLIAGRTRLVIGDVKETVPAFLENELTHPAGFISFDLDLYSSTKDALEIIRSPKRKMLRQTPLYFDDLDFISTHRWAGELLAIDEFNRTCAGVKIDKWYNVKAGKPFPEAYHWEKLFVAHDLDAISRYRPRIAANETPKGRQQMG